MLNPIEFNELPDRHEIELEFVESKRTMRCWCYISHNNIVAEVYDSNDEIIATSMRDLKQLGVVKATVIARHEVDFDGGY